MRYSIVLFAFSLLLYLAQPLAAKKQSTPGQISSAHSVAVVAHAVKRGGGRYLGVSDPGVEAQLTADAQASLSRAPGLSVVADPSPADLVLVVLLADWKTPYGEDLGLIFAGGGHASSASRVPLWVGEGQNGFSATDYLLAEMNP